MDGIAALKKKLFVSNMGDDSISVIDINKRSEASRIHLLSSLAKNSGSCVSPTKLRIGPHSLKIDKSRKNIYSVNCFDDSVFIIDSGSFSIKESFFPGRHPKDMVFNRDETYIYISNGDSNSVSVVDAAKKKVVAQIPVGIMPHGICMSPDGEYIYVANMGSDSISIIDTWSNSKVSCIPVGRCPVEVMTSKDGKYLFATCSYMGCDRKGTLSIISTRNLKIIKDIEVGIMPVQMAVSKKLPYIYVTNMGSDDVCVIDLNRFQKLRTIKTGKMPRGIALTEKREVLIGSSEENIITVIDEGTFKVLGNIEAGIEPTSMLYVEEAI